MAHPTVDCEKCGLTVLAGDLWGCYIFTDSGLEPLSVCDECKNELESSEELAAPAGDKHT
jgi:hypothetical protein